MIGNETTNVSRVIKSKNLKISLTSYVIFQPIKKLETLKSCRILFKTSSKMIFLSILRAKLFVVAPKNNKGFSSE